MLTAYETALATAFPQIATNSIRGLGLLTPVELAAALGALAFGLIGLVAIRAAMKDSRVEVAPPSATTSFKRAA